ncbi:MAG: hypothetical protein LBI44_04680 [Oscillospiraceae bacterium]|jgi:hypothetical protein|nr:hypothetical protein [Oscillospiraceae bacterium]
MDGDERNLGSKLKKALPFLALAVIFVAAGFAGGYIAARGGGAGRAASPGARLLPIALIGLSVYAGAALHTVLHEAGHLLCGAVSGYRFVSFSVAGVMFVGENGKLRLKRLGVAGMAGQCLMSPPVGDGYSYPFLLYNLGGSLMNFAACAVFAALYAATRGGVRVCGRSIYHHSRRGGVVGSIQYTPA